VKAKDGLLEAGVFTDKTGELFGKVSAGDGPQARSFPAA
jgi:hypothetical protein